MTDEEIEQKFKETYPDFMRGDTPLSPYFDIWCYGIEIIEQENNKLLDVINNQDVKIADLEKQIEKMKQCGNCGNKTIGNCEYCKRKPNQIFADTLTSDYWRLKEIKRK